MISVTCIINITATDTLIRHYIMDIILSFMYVFSNSHISPMIKIIAIPI